MPTVRHIRAAALLVAAGCLLADPVLAADAESGAESAAEASPGRRVAAGATAVVAGPVVHGAGHFVRGETGTGWWLLAGEGIGLAGAVGGIAGLAVTGAAPETVHGFTWLTIHGVGLFTTSWLADIYGSVSTGRGAGAPLRTAPWLTLDVGHRAIHDPVFDYGHLIVLGAEWRYRLLTLEARTWLAADDDNQRVQLWPRWRILGARPDRPAADGSFLDVRTGLNWHRYGTERFATMMGEVALRGRLDLHPIGRTLRGSFAEAELGIAAGGTQHEGFDAEEETLLLGGFAYGMYLGHARDGFGEASLYYDHRHDGYVAGMKAPGLGSGAPGHVGARARLRVFGRWGVDVRGAVGSSWLGGVSLVHQMGGRR